MLERQNSRERLLDAADALMHDRGYEAVSVAYLCAAADARIGNLWPSKRDLALAMLGRAWERNCKRLFDPIFNNDDTVIEKFLNYGEFLANGFTANREKAGHMVGCRFGNFAAELSTRDSVVHERVSKTLILIAGMFETAIHAAMKRGELADNLDATDIACAILAPMEGLMVIAKANNDPDMLRRLGRDSLKLMDSNNSLLAAPIMTRLSSGMCFGPVGRISSSFSASDIF